METTNLPDVKFKILVTRMLNKLRERMDELSVNFNKMRNMIFKMNALERIKSLDEEEDLLGNLENGVAKNTQSKQQQENRI